MRRAPFWLLCVLLVMGASACGVVGGSDETPTITPSPSITPTATATIDWFPATPSPTLAPTRAVTATPTPQLGLGQTLLTDDFSDTTQWAVIKNTSGSAAYGRGEFTLALATPKAYLTSLRKSPDLSDFYLEITVNPSLCVQADSYGLLLRAANDFNYYRWVITCGGQTRLERVRDSFAVLVQDWVLSPQIPPGPQSELRLGAWLNGKEMRFFINGVEQFSASDPVFASGRLGFFARSSADTPLTVNFQDLTVQAIDPSALPTRTPTPAATLQPAAP